MCRGYCKYLIPQFDQGGGHEEVSVTLNDITMLTQDSPSTCQSWYIHLYTQDPCTEIVMNCSICYVATQPGKYTCPPNWTREYYGYLMAERHNHHRSTFECVDVAPEAVTGGHTNQNGAHVEPRCGSLPCPPYDQ